ncbi:hypothetical protein [Microbulbifer sp. SAOS-129_SWC]
MSRKLLYRREDRVTVRHLFTLIECLAGLMVAILLGIALFS